MEKQSIRIFIGSSGEQKRLVEWLTAFIHSEYPRKLEPVPWNIPWTGGRFTLENLLEHVDTTDACIIFWTPDDLVEFRGVPFHQPRDNLIFETGLFIAVHGKERTQIMIPTFPGSEREVKKPSDMFGLTWNYYLWPDSVTHLEATGLPKTARDVCQQLLDLGPRPRRASLLKNLSGLPDVEEVSTFIGSWSTMHTHSIAHLASREETRNIDMLVIYRLVGEVRRPFDAFKKRSHARLRACFGNMWNDDLVKAYQLKIKDRDQKQMKDAVIDAIKALLGQHNIDDMKPPKEMIAKNLVDPPQANYEIRLTDQRITYSYYRVDDFAFIIPLSMITTQNLAPLVWVLEQGTTAFDYYLNEYNKVFEEAEVKVYPRD